jgi:hypothetical protein
MFSLICISVLSTVVLLAASGPIADESVRMQALGTIFHGMSISVVEGQSIDDSWHPYGGRDNLDFPDALKAERVYQIVGNAVSETERCTAGDVLSRKLSTVRELRFQVYPWPGNNSPTDLLAILQYRFKSVNPPGACTSIGRLVRVTKSTSVWKVGAEFLFDTTHHTAIQSIRLIDLSSDGVEELLVESDSSGGGYVGSALTILDVTAGRFRPLIRVAAQASGEVDTGDAHLEYEYKQTIDIPRTIREHGRMFCFTKSTYAEQGKRFATPLTSGPCYPPDAENSW